MTREELKSVLPHREPMLLVDKSELIGEDKTVSEYTVRGDEFFLQGHFPGDPVVPGVILCEIMAQSSALITRKYLEGRLAMYAGLDDVRFKKAAHPGDTVHVEAVLVEKKAMFFVIDASATVEGKLCCSARMSFMITDRK